jgi:hypothetical protein
VACTRRHTAGCRRPICRPGRGQHRKSTGRTNGRCAESRCDVSAAGPVGRPPARPGKSTPTSRDAGGGACPLYRSGSGLRTSSAAPNAEDSFCSRAWSAAHLRCTPCRPRGSSQLSTGCGRWPGRSTPPPKCPAADMPPRCSSQPPSPKRTLRGPAQADGCRSISVRRAHRDSRSPEATCSLRYETVHAAHWLFCERL